MTITAFVTGLWQDVRYAWRTLRRAPGFTLVAIATLALGIGASTSIFTVVQSVILRPLGFPEPDRLTMIQPTSGARVSPTYLHEWRLGSRALQDIAGWRDVRANLTGRGEPLEVLADHVTANFFAVLAMPPLLGRTFTVQANLSSVEPAAILSHGLWQRQFGGDPRVIGQPITLDGERLTIIGVMPEGVTVRTTELSESRAEIWVPFPLVADRRPGMGGSFNVVGRLAPGATPEQAQAELTVIAQRIEQELPSYSRDWGVRVIPLHDATVRDVRLALFVLFGAVGILLLIACANVASLVLNRATARHAELALRLSLGATRLRLARQVMTESLVLGVLGGTLGAVLAVWGTRLLVAAVPPGFDLPRVREIGVDLRVLLFALVVTILTAMIFGLIPALSSTRTLDPHSALRAAVRGSSTDRSRMRVGGSLVVSEIALALVLLAGAGLLARSFWELSRVAPGFQAAHVLTMSTTLPQARYDSDERVRQFGNEIVDRIQSLPGIRAVGSVNYLPMSRFGAGSPFEIEGRPASRADDRPGSWISTVGGRYFEAMGIPLLRGRFPSPADTERTGSVVIIDEELARRYWPNEDPIGQRVLWRQRTITAEIIGIVGGVRWGGMHAEPQATTYFWFPQRPARELTIVVSTPGDPNTIARSVADQVKQLDPNQPVGELRAMNDLVAADLAQPRFTMLLIAIFAIAALFLAAIGVYGVIAFGVTQRTQEIGVRVALGAQQGDVLRLFMRRGILLTGVGVAIGVAGALATGRFVRGLLYDVAPNDPITLLSVSLFLAAVAVLSTYLPARRATRVNPIAALRTD